jgi:hypothetical protein
MYFCLIQFCFPNHFNAVRNKNVESMRQESYAIFFSLMFLMEQKFLSFIFSSATPQRTAYSEVSSQKAAHLRTGSPLQAGEIAGFEPRTAVLQSRVATNEPPLPPYVILPERKEKQF